MAFVAFMVFVVLVMTVGRTGVAADSFIVAVTTESRLDHQAAVRVLILATRF